MSTFLNPVDAGYRLLALAFMALTLVGFGWVKGAEHGEAKLNKYVAANDAAVLAQVKKGAARTAALQADALILEEVKNDQINAIDARLATALGQLRQRPARRPDVPGAPSACKGATGADLSGTDGGFLAGEAARGDRLRAALGQCQARYDAAVKALTP